MRRLSSKSNHLAVSLLCAFVGFGAAAANVGCKESQADGDDDDDDDDGTSDDSEESSADGDDDDDLEVVVKAEISALSVVPNPGPEVSGSGTFVSDGSKVTFEITLEKCPEGMHGLHIHAGTECGDDGSAAMAHWDPLMVDVHGEVNSEDPHHAGDAGMVECDADGKGTFTIETDEWNLDADDDLNPIGHAVILHGVDPAQRIACGVIEADGDGGKIELAATTLSANPAPDLEGSAGFSIEGDEVTLTVNLSGCPTGMHGVHIHEGSECGEDGAKAGAHWDPEMTMVHGQVNSDEPHHAGDAGMIECDENMEGTFSITTKEWNLDADDDLNPTGHAFIVHGLDMKTRIGCGVIE
jgi:Cu/Zn superoxide dismutase